MPETKPDSIIMHPPEIRRLDETGLVTLFRVVEPPPVVRDGRLFCWSNDYEERFGIPTTGIPVGEWQATAKLLYCPFGVPGDRRWVAGEMQHVPGCGDDDKWCHQSCKRHGQCMYVKPASRYDIEIVDVRVMQLQYATEDDAISNGALSGNWKDDVGVGWRAIRLMMPECEGDSPWVWRVDMKRCDQ